MKALKWLWAYLRHYKASMFFVAVFTVAIVSFAFIQPVVVGRLVDGVVMPAVSGETKTDLLFFYVFLLIGIVVAKEILGYFKQIILENTSQGVVKKIRNKLYSKLQSLDCTFFDNTRTGDLMSRLTMDTDAVRQIVAGTLPELFNQLVYVVIGFTVIFSISASLMLALLSVAPFIGVSAYLLAKNVKASFVDRRESNARLNTVVQENISGNRVVKAYAKEEFEIEKFEKHNQNYMDTFMDFVHTWMRYAPTMLAFVFVINIIFIVYGGILVMNGSITLGEFTAVNGCLWCIVIPMESIGNFINQFQQFNASTLKIRSLEEEEPLIKNREIKKRDTGISGSIRFKNVTFAYDGDKVLKNINFSANAGDTIAIIGPTGSGKSTIVNLLSRFYDPTYGTIYIDDINLKNIDLKTVHQNVASAMQDVFLFSDTIQNNIAYGAPNATLDDVIRVAKEADAHGFISKLPDGYDTVVGERGVGLSGGQRQRISLARALLKNPSILILDDTTSALDMETEFAIQENLKKTGRTKIIIAHRISSVKNADLILVLNQGNLVEWGTHETLMELNGYYKGVFDHQFGDFTGAPAYHINHPVSENIMKNVRK